MSAYGNRLEEWRFFCENMSENASLSRLIWQFRDNLTRQMTGIGYLYTTDGGFKQDVAHGIDGLMQR